MCQFANLQLTVAKIFMLKYTKDIFSFFEIFSIEKVIPHVNYVSARSGQAVNTTLVGLLAGFGCLLLIIVIVALIYLKRRRREPPRNRSGSGELSMQDFVKT